MSKITPPAGASDVNAQLAKSAAIAKARTSAGKMKPVSSIQIKRPGLGRIRPDGRRSGGHFALKRLIIAKADNIADDESIIDTKQARTLCVPLNMDLQSYPTILDDEAVVEEFEDLYESEQVRDHILAQQVDPHWYAGRKDAKGRDWPASLGFGHLADPMQLGNTQPEAGKAKLPFMPSELVGA